MPLWDNGRAGKMLKLNLTLITFIHFQVSTNRQPNAISTVDKERSADSLELQMTTYQDTSSTLCELSSFVILLVSNAGISKSQRYRLPQAGIQMFPNFVHCQKQPNGSHTARVSHIYHNICRLMIVLDNRCKLIYQLYSPQPCAFACGTSG